MLTGAATAAVIRSGTVAPPPPPGPPPGPAPPSRLTERADGEEEEVVVLADVGVNFRPAQYKEENILKGQISKGQPKGKMSDK